MLSPQVIMLGVGVGVGVLMAVSLTVSSVYTRYRRNQQHNGQYRRQQLREPEIDDSPVGPCSFCKGDVTQINGYQPSCHHYAHYTCAATMTSTIRNTRIKWNDICPACRNDRNTLSQERARLRRTRNAGKCANCQLEIKDGQQSIRLNCNHQVHEICWERMESSGLTTCPECMDI